MDTLEIIAKVIGIYSLGLLLIGTIGNFCAALVCLRKSLRKTPTFVFIGFALFSDTVSLYFWNINHYLEAFESYVIEDISVTMCRLATFFQTTSLQWSAWLLVILTLNVELLFRVCFTTSFKVFMSIERYLSVRIIKWRTSYFKTNGAIFASIAMLIILVIINLSFVLFINYDTAETNITCFVDDVFTHDMEVSMSVVSVAELRLVIHPK